MFSWAGRHDQFMQATTLQLRKHAHYNMHEDMCKPGCLYRHDFLGILEPFMMEEKKGLVDFLRSAVGCFKDLPRGHIINLAQHMQQVITAQL